MIVFGECKPTSSKISYILHFMFLRDSEARQERFLQSFEFWKLSLQIKVLFISDGCCTEFDIINDPIFNLMTVVESGIPLKNHVSCNLC